MAARSRKRAAPGSEPKVEQYQDFTPQSISDFSWPQDGSDPSLFPQVSDPYQTNMYSSMANQNLPTDNSQNQLARRNMQNMISRNNYPNGNNEWMGDPSWTTVGMSQPSDEDKIDAEARVAKDAGTKSRKQIPPFVIKLRSFLDEEKNTNLIRWSTEGDSFIVLDEEEFARTLIPELFKHANYASFVRQLNMYGFHKQVGLSDNSMRASERKNKSPSEYKNLYFRRGKPDWMWLIQKPRTQGRTKAVKAKTEEPAEEEEAADVETVVPEATPFDEKPNLRGASRPLLISQGSESGTLAKEELAELHREVKLVRQQNLAIANAIRGMKQEQEQQVKAFHEQNSRHENSINAILTFLATVYNRSLEGHTGQDAGMNFAGALSGAFAGAMPQNFQQQYGSVVDVGDLGEQDMQPRASSGTFPKRQQLLLGPPTATSSTNITRTNPTRTYSSTSTGSARRASNHPRSAQPSLRQSNSGFVLPEDGDMLSWVNAVNSNEAATPSSQMDFGEALSHLQNRNGKGPLSASERNGMLEMMSSGNGSNAATPQDNSNAIMTPPARTPIMDSPKMLNFSNDLETVNRTLQNSQQSLDNIISRLSPMSPGGPDFSGQEFVPPPDPVLDFDSMFNTDDYLNDTTDYGTLVNDFGDNAFGIDNDAMPGNGQFDGGNDDQLGGRIQSINGSEATTPAQTIEEDEPEEEISSPRKRRRQD